MILVILFSDDDDDDDDRIKRRESTFSQFVDLVCFLLVLFTGKVEVVLNVDVCRVEQEFRSSLVEFELNIIVILRKVRMKDQVFLG